MEKKLHVPDLYKKAPIDLDAPITAKGSYNMNFIDLHNEFEAVGDFMSGETFEVPIAGMDSATFERVYEEFYADETRDQYGVKNEVLKKIPTKTVSTEKKENDCAICMVPYKPGEKVYLLGCKHHFHSDCAQTWFDKASCCPLCRHDINGE